MSDSEAFEPDEEPVSSFSEEGAPESSFSDFEVSECPGF